jgi:predicted lipoprotein with Yx(FWY)xxD motif
MKARLLIPLAACTLLAACGGGGSSSSGPAATVSAKSIDGVGTVLIDANGAALYTPEQEAHGMVRCVGSCTSIWAPLGPGTSAPTGGGGVSGKLSVIKRGDGTRQVAYDGKPLYTFSQDPAPGKVTGNGVMDSFGGTAFTWHAITASGKAQSGSSSSSDKPRSYGY